MAYLRRVHTITTLDDPIVCGSKFSFPQKFDLNNNSLQRTRSDDEIDREPIHSESFVWDWPFSEDRQARGFLSKEKFCVCLPFDNGGTGESKGTLKKFEKLSGVDFIWTLGLCNNGFMGTYFWRIEIQILRDLNMLVLNASKDVARPDETSKRLKRVRKVYRLPRHYDITTLTTETYDWAIVIEAYKRIDPRNRKRPSSIQRADTFT
ncbi:hypothetical protein Tcan_07787 [Toxocara canis]|uniref:Uncharacterized protein n=2 Tax=Toxocara canis TaxID=6265 RepID=A0A0B2VTG4_TOXCA|nr:hypothetical protein Tcan_07787 [Toxocara canis]VDM43763.1 unnamed protein product [Toxocara canis]